MLKYLALTAGLLASACTATVPAYAKWPPGSQNRLIIEGRFGASLTEIKAECPTGDPLIFATNDPVWAAATLWMISGMSTRAGYLEWLGEYRPNELPGMTKKINECFLGEDKPS